MVFCNVFKYNIHPSFFFTNWCKALFDETVEIFFGQIPALKFMGPIYNVTCVNCSRMYNTSREIVRDRAVY